MLLLLKNNNLSPLSLGCANGTSIAFFLVGGYFARPSWRGFGNSANKEQLG
jgi:hypothetical protein